jgi:preprotein translocase subunit SecD
MIQIPKWQVILVLVICVLGVIYAAPNALNERTADALPDWGPSQQINLGLDLRGGSHLLLEVGFEEVLADRMEAMEDAIRLALRKADIGYVGLGVNAGKVVFSVRDPADTNRVRDIVRELEGGLEIAEADGQFTIGFTEQEIEERKRAVVDQSIEIVRRRIDETGTKEPTIQRQGEDRILLQLPGVDDPERIKDLLGQTAVLTFHLVDNTALPGGRTPPGSEVLEGEPGPDGTPQEYVVQKRVVVSGENLVDAQPSFQDGQPVVSFRFDTVGGKRFGDATSKNVGRYLAIVLDEKVISAPVIRTAILGGSGIISGSFTVQETQDLALLLRAGALPAPLHILEERTVGPGLGADSIAAGKIASIIGLVLVVIFMVAAYGRFGVMANIALVFNLALLVAVLSVLQATLTLPGIAGVVLTIGMAVDANVLIFERIREEIAAGRTPISAVDAGYRRALTTIVDSNLTTLIAAVILYAAGTGPVRGFAVTLSIGIVTSMFTAIMVTRLMVVTWLRRTRPVALAI